MPSPGAANPPAIRIALDSGPEAKKPDSTPLLVKSNARGHQNAGPISRTPRPALPSPLAVASANDNALSSLMSSASPTFPKPSLATTRISQGVSQGLLIKRVQPKYPQAALTAHAEGAVQIEATINKEGNVTNLKVLSGDPVLAHAALEAVRQWRYKPYYLDGEPVEIQTADHSQLQGKLGKQVVVSSQFSAKPNASRESRGGLRLSQKPECCN